MNKILIYIILKLEKIPFIKRWADRKRIIIENTDPESIKISDIASFYCLPNFVAKKLLDLSVRMQDMEVNDDKTYRLKNGSQREDN